MPSREGTLGRIKSHHTTAEYVANYEASGMGKPELGRYCDGCGRLPSWCECDADEHCGGGPNHGFVDRDGKYHPAPGCNVVVKGLSQS